MTLKISPSRCIHYGTRKTMSFDIGMEIECQWCHKFCRWIAYDNDIPECSTCIWYDDMSVDVECESDAEMAIASDRCRRRL